MPAMFNHRHYAAIAKVVSEIRFSTPGGEDWTNTVDGLNELFKGDNPNYDPARFKAACAGKPLTRKDAR